MDLRSFLAQSADLSDPTCVDDFASYWTSKRLKKGAHLARQEHPETYEYILLEGCLTSSICDHDGKEICVGFYVGPCVVTPNIARTRNDASLVSIAAVTDALLFRIDQDLLSHRMIESEPVRNWANGILRDALSRKVDREWCLAALGGADRLRWFRETYPGYEDVFTHSLIASYLGITPVTLSRLRSTETHR
jgi:CRP-like cAMP-binding protein